MCFIWVYTYMRKAGHLPHHLSVFKVTVDVVVLRRVIRQHVQLPIMDVRCVHL